MGMHEGILAASKPWPDLHGALQKHCGTLQDQGAVAPERWLDLPQGEDAFHVTWRDGRSYLLDPALVLTSSPDLVVSLSGELDCMVASIGAETVSGTFWLTAAEKGRLVRLHWNVRSTLTLPLDLGDKLASENLIPLEDADGRGLLACLGDLGLDPAPAMAPTSGQKYLWVSDTLPAAGDLQAQINAHHDRFKRPDQGDWTKHIKPVPRSSGGFDLQYQPPSEKPSLLKRLFGK
jgi:hypothetical protein